MAEDRDLYSGLIRLHILHHAVKEPIFGLGMQQELERHGYRISAGTLYPLLKGLERKGYLHTKLGKERQIPAPRLRRYPAWPNGFSDGHTQSAGALEN